MIDCNYNAIQKIVEITYQDVAAKLTDEHFLQERAILTPKNETVHQKNDHILNLIPTKERIYFSSDSICRNSTNFGDDDALYPIEFFNSLKFGG